MQANSTAVASELISRPPDDLQSGDIKASLHPTNQLVWSSKDVLLNIPHRDAYLWSNKFKILNSLSQLLRQEIRPFFLSEFFYLPSNKDFKRLFLTFTSPIFPRRILNAGSRLNLFGIQIQRSFKQMGPKIRLCQEKVVEGGISRSTSFNPTSHIQDTLAYSPPALSHITTVKPLEAQMASLTKEIAKSITPMKPPIDLPVAKTPLPSTNPESLSNLPSCSDSATLLEAPTCILVPCTSLWDLSEREIVKTLWGSASSLPSATRQLSLLSSVSESGLNCTPLDNPPISLEAPSPFPSCTQSVNSVALAPEQLPVRAPTRVNGCIFFQDDSICTSIESFS